MVARTLVGALLPLEPCGTGSVENTLFTILVHVVQVPMANALQRGGPAALGYYYAGMMGPRNQIWHWGARRAGRRRVYRGGRFKRGGGKSRRACLMGTHPEKKFLDQVISFQPNLTGFQTYLFTCAQGASESQRVGRKAILTDILIKGHLKVDSTSNKLGSNRIRLDVVQDTQPNQAVFAVGDYLQQTDINGYKNLVFAKRFKTLWTKTWTINASSGGGDAAAQHTSESLRPFNISLKPCIDFEYSGNGGVIGDCTVNSLHLIAYEETVNPATSVQAQARFRFVE